MMAHAANGRFLAILSSIVVVATVATSIYLNPPRDARNHKMDVARTQDLQKIQTAVMAHWKKHLSLPADMDELVKEDPALQSVKDPVSSAPYTYQKTDDKAYKLCADFAFASDDQMFSEYGYTLPMWKHGTGHYCYDLKADAKPTPCGGFN